MIINLPPKDIRVTNISKSFTSYKMATETVRYFGNLSNIDDRVRNISWQTLNLTQTVTLTLILTIYIHTYTRPSMLDGLQK